MLNCILDLDIHLTLFGAVFSRQRAGKVFSRQSVQTEFSQAVYLVFCVVRIQSYLFED